MKPWKKRNETPLTNTSVIIGQKVKYDNREKSLFYVVRMPSYQYMTDHHKTKTQPFLVL